MKIIRPAFEEVRAHASDGYPNEVCGILIAAGGNGMVTQTRRVRNTVVERARDRYEMDPLDQIRIQRECDEAGLEIVGYYHSHPDHPARASVTDSEGSWASTFYLIVSCVQGSVVEWSGFLADRDGAPLQPESVEVV